MSEFRLPQKPRLHRGYHVLTASDASEIQLQSDGRALRLQPSDSNGLLKALLDLLDGTHTMNEILASLSDFDRAQVIDAIARLHASHLLQDADPAMAYLSPQQRTFHDAQLTFLAHFVPEPEAMQAVLARSCVAVLGLGQTGARLVTALAASGIGHCIGIHTRRESPRDAPDIHADLRHACLLNNPWAEYRDVTLVNDDPDAIQDAVHESQIVIAAIDGQDPALLERINAACLASGQMWTAVGVRAWEGFVGPTVIPRETACYTCYNLRTKANLSDAAPYQRYEDHLKSGAPQRMFGSLPQFGPVIAGIAAIEVVKILTRYDPPTTFGRVLTLDFLAAATQFHPVLKLPRCPACGVPSRQLPMQKPWTS